MVIFSSLRSIRVIDVETRVVLYAGATPIRGFVQVVNSHTAVIASSGCPVILTICRR